MDDGMTMEWSYVDYEKALDLGKPLTDEQLNDAEAILESQFETLREGADLAVREMDRINGLLHKITVRRRMRKAANDRA